MALNNQGVGAEGLLAAAASLSQPADSYGNDSRVEALWAVKAMEHAEVYFNILCSVDPKQIPRLSACDDDIYAKFRQEFPGLDVAKVTEDQLKSEEAKKKWREFCETFKTLDDYSFATLLRLDASGEYSEENSTIVPKVQFYALEIARNREGHNDSVRSNFQPKPRRHRLKAAEKEATATLSGGVNMAEVEQELKQILMGSHQLLQ